jgi:tRNA 2-thiouridine synthesizing protein A
MPDSNSAESSPDQVLDTRGSYCPVPVIETAKTMAAMEMGQVLELISDDIGVKLDIPAWCQGQGQRMLTLEEEGRSIRIRILKTGDVA